MADSTLSALSAASALAGTELFYSDDGSANVKVTATQIQTFARSAFAKGTITDPAQLIDDTVTWNDAADTFTGWKLDVTDTASASASLLLDLQVGSSTIFNVTKAGKVKAANGTAGAPSYSFTANATDGFYRKTDLAISQGGGDIIGFSVSIGRGIKIRNTLGLGWVSGATVSGAESPDLSLYRDAADTLAQRNGTSAQIRNHYDTYASSTDYHRLATKTARATLSSVSGATVTATGIIPAGAVVVGVTTKVTTGLGATGGTTGYTVGDHGAADPDRWGVASTITAGTVTQNADWTNGTIEAFLTASDVVITNVGGNFDGTGVIYVSVQYFIGEAD